MSRYGIAKSLFVEASRLSQCSVEKGVCALCAVNIFNVKKPNRRVTL
jgi:hypothetical protein